MQERRKFLTVLSATAATVGLTQILGCGSDEEAGEGASQPTGGINGGKATDVTVGSLKKLEGQKILLGRDAQGLYAMTAICTHLQCDMSGSDGVLNNEGILCVCHASKFDKIGNPLGGPAPSPLNHFALTVGADGSISIDTSKKVASTTRTAVAG